AEHDQRCECEREGGGELYAWHPLPVPFRRRSAAQKSAPAGGRSAKRFSKEVCAPIPVYEMLISRAGRTFRSDRGKSGAAKRGFLGYRLGKSAYLTVFRSLT